MSKLTYKHFSLCLSLFLFSQYVNAYQLIPLTAKIAPSGNAARQTFQIKNPSDKPVAIELKMYQREMSVDGKDQLLEDNKNFLVHPTQVIILPKQTQAIRVQWLGDENLKKEQAYRLISEQIPVTFKKEEAQGAQVKLLLRFIASVYVAPRNIKPKLVITKHSIFKDATTEEKIKISVTNIGSKHLILKKSSILIETEDSKHQLNNDQLAMLVNQNFLVDSTREFIIPKPQNMKKKILNAIIQVEE